MERRKAMMGCPQGSHPLDSRCCYVAQSTVVVRCYALGGAFPATAFAEPTALRVNTLYIEDGACALNWDGLTHSFLFAPAQIVLPKSCSGQVSYLLLLLCHRCNQSMYVLRWWCSPTGPSASTARSRSRPSTSPVSAVQSFCGKFCIRWDYPDR